MANLMIKTPTEILIEKIESNETLNTICNFIVDNTKKYEFFKSIVTDKIIVNEEISIDNLYLIYDLFKRFGWRVSKKSSQKEGGKILYSFEIVESRK